MDQSLDVKLQQLQYFICEKHQEPLGQMCLKTECQKYFKLECVQCIEQHPDHSAKFIKSVKQILATSVKGFDQLQKSIDGKVENNQNQDKAEEQKINQDLKNLAQEYLILSEFLKTISDNILMSAKTLSQGKQFPIKQLASELEQIIYKAFSQNSSNNLQDALQDLKTFIKCNNNDFSLQFVQELPKQNNSNLTIDFNVYHKEINYHLQKLTENLKIIQKKSDCQNQFQDQSKFKQFSTDLKHENLSVIGQNNNIVKKNKQAEYASVLCKNKIDKHQNAIWSIKINKLSKEIRIGLGQKENLKSRKFQGSDQGQCIFILWINSEGYKYNQYFEEENRKEHKLGKVKIGQIFTLEYRYLESILILRSEHTNTSDQLKLDFTDNEDFHFFLTLEANDDEIEIL